ncbi:hypothetical protein SPRG_17622 [Saprolegnia parasitica CBS 223.65]|uniref:Transmembrane protein n=1 Tax=Saprolegnia parasitica (strain CBS 223.65) TaxID=695850 RepID=A0A067BRH8_SAPPC|nr:hypothetical protein SPRG_17622 [Saprolegnia parasitica CBS 223.65]KDO16916.1 hypothetical protein SPRG_17622 [Saprolegnia parasitica CBS 223.65]|eukprot:XP_012212377.1 hypothetical protein SPRG_17622 [Saprolegnia parasitica CBS 223.65]
MDVWTGPRCTKYDLEAVTLAVVGSVLGLVLRLRRNNGVLARQQEEIRREKHSESSSHFLVREPSQSDVQITR